METYYFGLNFLITLIWWIIPWYINITRWQCAKYLSIKMVIWPMKEKMFLSGLKYEQNTSPNACHPIIFVAILGTLIGIIVMTPAILLYSSLKLFRWIHRCIKPIMFSKEEEVQIALGSIIEKE